MEAAEEEVMPPKSSVKPEWEVTDFGGFDLASTMAKQSAAAGANGGNGAKSAKIGAAHKPSGKSNGQPEKQPDKAKVAARILFGRGPKGKEGRK